MIWTFLASPLGRYLLIGTAAVAFVGIVVALIYRQGEAAAAAAAAGAIATRTMQAAKARTKVDHSSEAEKDDPFNRDKR